MLKLVACIAFLLQAADVSTQASAVDESPDRAALVAWEEMPPVPGGVGLAGPIAGIVDGHLVVAGGANFPGAPRWETDKQWHDTIHLLELAAPGEGWRLDPLRLPGPRAYGVSLSHRSHGLIHIGGSDGTNHHVECLLMNLKDGSIVIEPLPPLPEPVAYGAGALVGETVYVIGGQPRADSTTASEGVYALDLTAEDDQWIRLESIPGAPGRILPVAGAHEGKLFVFGGCALSPAPDGGASRTYLDDAWCYDPDSDSGSRWTRLSDMPRPAAAAPSPALNLGRNFLAIIGGDDGSNAGRVAELRDDHPGFPPEMQAYHVITDEWTLRPGFEKDPGPDQAGSPSLGRMPPVTTPVVSWEGSFIIPSGETRPRVRSSRVWMATPGFDAPRFTTFDWVALGTYLAALVLMGLYFMKRERGTEDFFLGGRRVPWWAAGISIFATQLSAITFMAIPAKSYASDWKLFVQSFGIFLMAPVVAYLFLPFFRRLNVTTAYEYLERRFSVGIRMFGSAQYILFQFGRMAVVVYLPAIALQAVTGIDVYLCILLMGVLCIVYTVLGGIEAVIWSDVLQTFVLLGGALLILFACAGGVDGGISELFTRAGSAGHLRLADASWDFTREALPVVILGGIFINLVPYASDQSVVQRYLTTHDEVSARKAIWLGGILAIPASILFFGMGSALYGFYDANPDRLVPLASTDQIVPWFLVNEIPHGIAGLVIAGIFAAAMSSLDSSMNSSATALVTDFYRRLFPGHDDSRYLWVARMLTVLLGVVGTGFALILASMDAGSIFDAWLAIVGLFASGLCGLFVLGIFTRRPGSLGAVAGILVSAVLLVYVRNFTQLNSLLYAAIGVVSCVLSGWLIGLVLPTRKDVSGTTFASRGRTHG